ncbi:MAG TPA: hypothetical protein PLI00_09025, partial [Pseudomonadota bacterium]|nr:hypothetical protein [Pseudomonadota bacterium]
QRVVASDNVVAILRGRGVEADGGVAAVRRATGARYLVQPRAQRMDAGWRIELALLEADGGRRTVEATGADAVAATRAAGAALLGLLGRQAEPDPTRPDTLAEVLQRADAALLSLDFDGARRVLDAAPAALQGEPALGLRRAQADFRSGQLARASAIARGLLDAEPGIADPVLRARVLNQLGAVVLIEGRAAEAETAFREAVALVATREQPAVLGQAYTGLASALADQGRYADAAVAFGRARVPLVLAGDTLALARVDANEGMLERLRGRPEVALPLLQRAVGVFERFGALNELFVTVAAEVEAHLLLLDPQAALAASTPRYRERNRLANASNREYLVLHHARALAAAGRTSQARQLLEELDRAAPSEPPLRPGVAAALAELELEAGNAAAASRWAGMAVEALDQEAWRLRARTWLTRVRALRMQGDLAAAGREARALDQWAQRYPEFAFIGVLARLAEAELDAASGQVERAMARYAQAQSGAEAWGVPADLALVALSHAQALIESGAAEEASAVAGRVLRWADRDYGIAVLQARLYQALGQESARDASLARARDLAGERPLPALAEPRPAMAQELGFRG